MDAEVLYGKLRDLCESEGCFISDEADDMLADAARAVAEHPESDGGAFGDPDPNGRYSCFTPANNAFVAGRVETFLDVIRNQQCRASEVEQGYENLLAQIQAHVPEVTDTEPRNQIQSEVEKACRSVGWRGPFDGW